MDQGDGPRLDFAFSWHSSGFFVMKKLRECRTKSSICVVGCNVTQVLQWGGPHPLNAGIHLIPPVYIAVIFPSVMTPKSRKEIGWPPLHCACCGGAWQISTLQKCWISMDVCLIKTAWPFPDLASRRLWHNGTFIRLSGRDSFSSDLLYSPDATVYLIQFHTSFNTASFASHLNQPYKYTVWLRKA